MAPVIWIQGEFVENEKAFVPVQNRGFLSGDGVFTTLKVMQGHPCFLVDHLQRLQKHCEVLKIHPPTIDSEKVQELILRNQAQEGEWRLKIIVTGGTTPSFDLSWRNAGLVAMTLDPYQNLSGPNSLTLFPQPILRPVAAIKSLAYLDRLWVHDFARQRGYDDALTINAEGFLLEGAFSNLFWRVGSQLWTPDPALPLLYGISISYIIKAAQRLGMQIHYCRSRLEDIDPETQVFTINSLQDIRPVESIEERKFSRDNTFEKALTQVYRQFQKGSLLCQI